MPLEVSVEPFVVVPEISGPDTNPGGPVTPLLRLNSGRLAPTEFVAVIRAVKYFPSSVLVDV